MAEQNQANHGVAGGQGGSQASGLVAIAGLIVIGYFGYWMLAGSDRSEVRSCIEAAQRADVNGLMTLDFKLMLRKLDAAKEVTIMKTPPNDVGLRDIYYTMDGKPGRVICSA